MKTVRLKYLFLLLISTIAFAINAQTGRIGGKIIDKKTGEELIGVSVQIEGTSIGAVTDYEGKFIINNVQPGTYNLMVTYISYSKKNIKAVEVKAKETTTINTSLEESTNDLNEVVIQAEFKKESANALLIQQKNAVSVSSGVSADLIKKTPDRTTADVVKRISGASVQDGKFAIVRGLTDRYNSAFINGAPMPSTESDRKAFSLDLIPAAVIDNMMIQKTATPDMPGDFAGGFIGINTKDIPEESSFFVGMSGQYHSITTFKEGIQGPKSKTDWLAYDGGTRTIPADVMSTEESTNNTSFANNINDTKKFNNDYSFKTVNSFRPNISFQLGGSKRFQVGEKDQLGIIGTAYYNNSFKATPLTTASPRQIGVDQTEVNPNDSDGLFYNIANYRQTVAIGGIFNISYKLGNNSKFTFKNLYTRNAEDQTINRTGYGTDPNNPQLAQQYDDYIFSYQSSSMYSTQLSGEHLIPSAKIKVKYIGSFNNIHREMPDFRRLMYQSNKNNAIDANTGLPIDSAYSKPVASILPNARTFTPLNSGRFSSILDEQSYHAGYDVAIPFKLFKKSEVKVGGYHQIRTRAFNARTFMYSIDDNNKDQGRLDSLQNVSSGQIFNNQNIDSATYFQKETTQGSDQYDASSKLHAGYVMLDNKITSRLRLIWGARVESYNQKISSEAQGAQQKVDTTVVDILPSVNVVYELTDKINVRASFAKTVSRPEFREFAQLAFYEVNANAIITGNPFLIRTQIYNYDLKFEWYPSAGQTFSVNPFYKYFVNPIENTVNPLQGGLRGFGYQNAPSAQSLGVEFEARFNIGALIKAEQRSLWNRIGVFSNLALINSTVKLADPIAGQLDVVNSRPLQGQSPYVFNAGLNYNNIEKGFDVSVNANRVGRRIAYVANNNRFMIWENPRTVVDMSVSKTFKKKLQMKFIVGDLLAQDLVFYQDLNKNGKYEKGQDVGFNVWKNGFTTTLSFTYNF
jgi:outer membrane receptor protein involved in Fe transport